MLKSKLWPLLLCLLLLLPMVAAVSISPALVRIARPAPQEFQFTVGGANNIDVYLSGDLAQYAQVRDSNPGSGQRTVVVAFNPPSQLEPGRHELIVGARESSGGSGTIGARAAIEAPIILEVPYTGSFGEVEVKPGLADTGEPVKFDVRVKNKGVAQLAGMLKLDVLLEGQGVAHFEQGVQALPVSENSVAIIWASANAPPARYAVRIVLEYDGKSVQHEASFTLGKPGIVLVKKPSILEAGAKNKAVFDLRSTSAKDQTVQATFSVSGRETAGSRKIPPFGDARLELDFDALGIEVGTVAASLKLSTGSFSKTEEWTIEMAARTSPAPAGRGRTVLGIALLGAAVLLILWSRRR